MRSLLDLDAVEAAKQIREGTVTSAEITNRYIAHLQKMNQKVNALSQERFQEARREAAVADQQVLEGKPLGRLHGVPISVKDCFHVAGMSTTAGLPYRNRIIETKDADIVAALKREGAIILGKTNTPALCFCQETDNKLHGRTNNPWNLERTAGGSSGGEGALIAAGGAAVGVGADIGGSIRFPSHCNGVIGFKSGNKQVSAIGNYPYVSIEEQDRMLGIGAMAKSVRDARLMNEIMAKTVPNPLNLQTFQLMIPGRQPGLPLGEETEAALGSLRNLLGQSYEVGEKMPPNFAQGALIWQQLMSIVGAKHIKEIMSESGRLHPIMEYLKGKANGNSEVHPYLSWALIGANLFKPSEKRVSEIRKLLKEGDEQLSAYFENQIVVLPVYHRAAPLHGRLYKELFSINKTYLKYIPYVAYANVWGLPALTVPVAEDANGLPIGVQLISRTGNEEALFQLGEVLEKEFRGYKRCEKYD